MDNTDKLLRLEYDLTHEKFDEKEFESFKRIRSSEGRAWGTFFFECLRYGAMKKYQEKMQQEHQARREQEIRDALTPKIG